MFSFCNRDFIFTCISCSLFSSKEQCDRGYYVQVHDVYPLAHSVLVLVDTTTPLISSYEGDYPHL